MKCMFFSFMHRYFSVMRNIFNGVQCNSSWKKIQKAHSRFSNYALRSGLAYVRANCRWSDFVVWKCICNLLSSIQIELNYLELKQKLKSTVKEEIDCGYSCAKPMHFLMIFWMKQISRTRFLSSSLGDRYSMREKSLMNERIADSRSAPSLIQLNYIDHWKSNRSEINARFITYSINNQSNKWQKAKQKNIKTHKNYAQLWSPDYNGLIPIYIFLVVKYFCLILIY